MSLEAHSVVFRGLTPKNKSDMYYASAWLICGRNITSDTEHAINFLMSQGLDIYSLHKIFSECLIYIVYVTGLLLHQNPFNSKFIWRYKN